jgi:hypothetical protein
MTLQLIGIDLAKNVFHLHGVDGSSHWYGVTFSFHHTVDELPEYDAFEPEPSDC